MIGSISSTGSNSVAGSVGIDKAELSSVGECVSALSVGSVASSALTLTGKVEKIDSIMIVVRTIDINLFNMISPP